MSDSQELIVPLNTGVSLQLDIFKPKPQQDGEQKIAICLHPWSWLGGQKNDPVLGSLVKPLLNANYHVIRYNSRSVGKSTGFSSFTGFSEAEDLNALVQWAITQVENVATVVLIGYSHGSLITSLFPVLPGPIRTYHILLSYPLGPRGWLTLFRTSNYQKRLEQLIQKKDSHVMIVFGDKDEFTSVSSYKTWVEKLQSGAQGSDRLRVAEIPNASHFWHGQYGRELGEVLRRWLP